MKNSLFFLFLSFISFLLIFCREERKLIVEPLQVNEGVDLEDLQRWGFPAVNVGEDGVCEYLKEFDTVQVYFSSSFSNAGCDNPSLEGRSIPLGRTDSLVKKLSKDQFKTDSIFLADLMRNWGGRIISMRKGSEDLAWYRVENVSTKKLFWFGLITKQTRQNP